MVIEESISSFLEGMFWCFEVSQFSISWREVRGGLPVFSGASLWITPDSAGLNPLSIILYSEFKGLVCGLLYPWV